MNATKTALKTAAPTKKSSKRNGPCLRDSVYSALEHYFTQMEGHPIYDLYNMVLAEVEAPLLKQVLDYTQGNQSKAAECLGLNRSTLRKKLRTYKLA